MLTMDDIFKANKLGAKGIRVLAIIPPQGASESESLWVLDYEPNSHTTASELPWYDR